MEHFQNREFSFRIDNFQNFVIFFELQSDIFKNYMNVDVRKIEVF